MTSQTTGDCPRSSRQRWSYWWAGNQWLRRRALAGVGRATVFRWLKNDPVFRAALNQWHDQIKSGCQSRLLSLTDKATDAVEKALDAGDARTALQLLKGMGMIKERAVGPTDPEEIRKRNEIEREERRIALKRDRAKLSMADMEAEMGM